MSRRLGDFDSDPHLLGVANGVVDLRRGTLLPVSPQLLVSKRCNVTFDPAAVCPRFDQFLAEVQPDPECRAFLQQWSGYCLTGLTVEQHFAFLHGPGANGKSVFIELLAWLLGDYAKKIQTEMLMQHQRSPQGPSPDIVGLKGVRFAYANETEEGRRLAEARVKELTGGDTLTGRVPYGKVEISFRTTHKLMLAGNHKPEIADMSQGMWRRVLLVGFEQTIPPSKREPHLLETLKTEGSGILSWALEGYRQWQQQGLCIPKAISKATECYRDEQDIIGEWLSDNCHLGPGLSVRKADLYQNYQWWTKANGHGALAQGRLTHRLNERGYRLQADKRTVTGLALKAAALAPNI